MNEKGIPRCTYFDHLHTVADIKQEYRRLALLHHPDRPGGDTATMQAINAQYHAALERCDGQTATGSDGNDHTYTYNADHRSRQSWPRSPS